MNKFEGLRRSMVDSDISKRGIKDERIIKAMTEIPRHLFVPQEFVNTAYSDQPLPIGFGQTISQPYIVALMISQLIIQEKSKVLEIGTGCGYQTAIIAKIAKFVTSIEIIPELANRARLTLSKLDISNVEIIVGDGSLGWKKNAPYQAIILSAAAPTIDEKLLNQLADGGVLVAPVGEKWQQKLEKWTREGAEFKREIGVLVSFVPLMGKYGWK